VSLLSRSLVTVAAGLALVSVAGCSGSSPGGTPPSSGAPSDALASVNPCALLKPSDATALGLPTQGKPPIVAVPNQPGCEYQSDAQIVDFFVDPAQNVDSSQHDSNQWSNFTRTTINGRAGGTGVTPGSEQAQICNAVFDAGKGMIFVKVEENDSSNKNDCADALKIAKLVEPNAPK
jgi:hypothetical protein